MADKNKQQKFDQKLHALPFKSTAAPLTQTANIKPKQKRTPHRKLFRLYRDGREITAEQHGKSTAFYF